MSVPANTAILPSGVSSLVYRACSGDAGRLESRRCRGDGTLSNAANRPAFSLLLYPNMSFNSGKSQHCSGVMRSEIHSSRNAPVNIAASLYSHPGLANVIGNQYLQ